MSEKETNPTLACRSQRTYGDKVLRALGQPAAHDHYPFQTGDVMADENLCPRTLPTTFSGRTLAGPASLRRASALRALRRVGRGATCPLEFFQGGFELPECLAGLRPEGQVAQFFYDDLTVQET